MKFYREYRDQRDRFEILAFHDAQVKSFDELDSKLKNIVKEKWNGRPLPFPILLDATGETVREWGIRSFPTTLLIDPEGNLHGNADVRILKEKLES